MAHDGDVKELVEFGWLLGGRPGPPLQTRQIVPETGAGVIK